MLKLILLGKLTLIKYWFKKNKIMLMFYIYLHLKSDANYKVYFRCFLKVIIYTHILYTITFYSNFVKSLEIELDFAATKIV